MASVEQHLEVRVRELEIFSERVKSDLYGREGTTEPGLVKEYSDSKASRNGQKHLLTGFVFVVGGIGSLDAVVTMIHNLMTLLGH